MIGSKYKHVSYGQYSHNLSGKAGRILATSFRSGGYGSGSTLFSGDPVFVAKVLVQ